jgi:hypothetical protein
MNRKFRTRSFPERWTGGFQPNAFCFALFDRISSGCWDINWSWSIINMAYEEAAFASIKRYFYTRND